MEPGTPPPPRVFEPADLVGEVFADRFDVVRLAATGANTAIFDAVDQHSGRQVTLKLVRPKLAASPSFRNRFDTTMRAVSALSHPNIAAVYDWGVARVGDASTAYVVNEHLSGGSLRDLFDRGRRLSPSQALAVGLDTCRALDHAHRRRFVHTEITPAKLVFGDDRRLRIVDFGLARLLGEPAWEQPDSVPTHVAWYSAPEQATANVGEADSRRPLDGRADVYALALTLHEAVTGTLPFKSDSTVAALAARSGRLMPVSADLGPLAAVLEAAGRPDPDERSTAAEFGKGLLGVASKLPRPEPLPLLSSGLFDTPPEQMRSPDDPTGGVVRRSPMAAPLVVVPLDEPDTDTDSDLADDGEAAAEAGEQAADQALVIAPLDASVGAGSTIEPTQPLVLNDADSQPLQNPLVMTEQLATAAIAVAEPEPMPKRRRRFPWKILLALLLVAALVGLGVLATQLFRTPTHLVPELTGMPEAEARNLVAPNDWEIAIQRERSDDVPEVDHVVRTAPIAGVELAEGEPFLIVVSDGPLLRELPDSTALPVAEAQTQLADRQLTSTVVDQNDEVVLPGIVISWSVPGDATLTAGSKVEPGTSVELIVSAGPALRTIPNLVGRPTAEAQAEIESIGLTFGVADQVFSDDVPLGVIVSQDLAEGTQVERGSGVTVVVSKGPDLVTFPDLSAAVTYDDAAAILVPAGFQTVLTFGDAQGAIQSVTIDGNAPQVGTTYKRGTLVEFTAL